MRNTRTKRLTTFFSLMALLGSLLVASTAGASHDAAVVDVGTLDLVLGSSGDSFEYVPNGATSSSGSQPLTENKCKINSAEPLVDLSATASDANPTPEPGLKDSVIGVKAKGEGNGEPCARINNVGDQMLIMELQADTGEFFKDKFIHGAQFGLKLKFGATAKVTLFDADGPVVSAMVSCFGSDCGADSGGDQVLLTLPAHSTTSTDYLGTKLVLEVVGTNASGAFGILDNANFDSRITIAEEFDGQIDCGGATDPIGSTSEINGIFWRIANATPETTQDPCDPKPFNAEVNQTGNVLTFSPAPAPGEDAGHFVGEISTLPTTGQPTHVLYYDPDSDGSAPPKVMQWCDVGTSSPPNQWTEGLTGPADEQRDAVLDFVGGLDNHPVLPGGETWCIVHSDSRTVSGNQSVTVFDVYGIGDPNFF